MVIRILVKGNVVLWLICAILALSVFKTDPIAAFPEYRPNCPISTSTDSPYPKERITFRSHYLYNPNVTLDGDDPEWRPTSYYRGPVTAESEVRCYLMLGTRRSDNILTLTLPETPRSFSSDLGSKDCWIVYDGWEEDSAQLGQVCEGQRERTFQSSGPSLGLVFVQGHKSGPRNLLFHYEALEKPNTKVVQLAVVVSLVIAAVGICFLLLKFTRCCLPCRKRWCPYQCTDRGGEREEGGRGRGGWWEDEEEEETAAESSRRREPWQEGDEFLRQQRMRPTAPSAPSQYVPPTTPSSTSPPPPASIPSAPLLPTNHLLPLPSEQERDNCGDDDDGIGNGGGVGVSGGGGGGGIDDYHPPSPSSSSPQPLHLSETPATHPPPSLPPPAYESLFGETKI